MNRRQAARYLRTRAILKDDFVPETGSVYKGKTVIDTFQTRNWNMAIVLFDDDTIATACYEGNSENITGRSILYLLEMNHIPEANVNYWISKYYHLDGDMHEMRRAKLQFTSVSSRWEKKLYLARDSSGNNYVIIVR